MKSRATRDEIIDNSRLLIVITRLDEIVARLDGIIVIACLDQVIVIASLHQLIVIARLDEIIVIASLHEIIFIATSATTATPSLTTARAEGVVHGERTVFRHTSVAPPRWNLGIWVALPTTK